MFIRRAKNNGENKKVKNAKEVTIDDIRFLSGFESKCYLLLKASGLKFSYESETFALIEGFKDQNVFEYTFRTKKKMAALKNKKLKPVERKVMTAERTRHYTPDFVIEVDDRKIYIEVKGFKTDNFSFKQKLFLKKLSEMSTGTGMKYEYALIDTLEKMNMLIDFLKKGE